MCCAWSAPNRPLKYALSFLASSTWLSVPPSYLALIDPTALFFHAHPGV